MSEAALTIANQQGNDLVQFFAIDSVDKSKYSPVPSNIASLFANIGITSGLTAIANNGHGLFRATVNPALLMSYSNGSISSIVKIGGKIASHSGFVGASAFSVFAPLLVFQVLSMATGQYYFHLISKQLSHIEKAIQDILSYLEDRDRAIVWETQKRLQEIYNQIQNDTLDSDALSRVHNYHDRISELSLLYRVRWEKKFDQFFSENPKCDWDKFKNANFHTDWQIYCRCLSVLACAKAVEFMIRWQQNFNRAEALQREYENYFHKFQYLSVGENKILIPSDEQKPLEKMLTAGQKIYKEYAMKRGEIFISESKRRELDDKKEQAFSFYSEISEECQNLSAFNLEYTNSARKVFQNFNADQKLLFDASERCYYVEKTCA